MKLTDYRYEDGRLTVCLTGHIDSSNAEAVEAEITKELGSHPGAKVEVDADKLEYISSAGLRIILRLKKDHPELRIFNVRSEVYEVLEMTGFTEMIDIQKAYRVISVEGCEVIGQGASGIVYRIDPDTIVKVFRNPDSLEEIHKEREMARTAFVLGIPTCIPYDIVKIAGGGYGSVMELLNAKSFNKLLINGEKTVDEVAKLSIDLLKQIHETEIKPETLTNEKEVALGWVEFDKDVIPQDQYEKLHRLISEIPEVTRLLHGDYHLKNVMLQNEEALLIDLDTICWGHPIFEISDMYNAYVAFNEPDANVVMEFLGIDQKTALEFWNKALRLYFDNEDEETVREIENKAAVISYARLLRRTIRKENGLYKDFYSRRLAETLEKVDTLLY